jgi:uncharacterized protein YbaP (TraB family)
VCWARVRPALIAHGVPEQAVQSMRPWSAFLALSSPMEPPKTIVDETVSRKAALGGKTLRSFETVVDQLRVFSGLPEEMQVALLCDSYLGAAALGPDDADMQRAWETGDDVAIAESFAVWARAYPAYYDALIRKRNARWTFAIINELEGSGVDFIAVGAGHLAGPDSVQTMLAAHGYDVERLTPRP